MSLKNIAVEGCTLELSAGTGTITITSQPSQKVKCDNKGAFFNKITFNISGYLGSNITNGDGIANNCEISATSLNVNIEGKAALLEGDTSVAITVTGTKPSSSGAVTATDIITVKVSDSGQNKVIAS